MRARLRGIFPVHSEVFYSIPYAYAIIVIVRVNLRAVREHGNNFRAIAVMFEVRRHMKKKLIVSKVEFSRSVSPDLLYRISKMVCVAWRHGLS
jgi:hypothetical protein